MTQTERLVRWLRANPGATSLEITQALAIVNVTGRISDARQAGYLVECKRRTDHRLAYWLVEREQGTLGLA